MMTYRCLLLLFTLLLTSCGAIQKARYYAPTSTEPNTQEWGDGLATADKEVCVWVKDGSAMYLALMAGPIGLPFFPLGILTSDPERPGYFDLTVWVVPEQYRKGTLKFDPKQTSVTFTNGVTSKPRTVQVSRFKTEG